MADITVFIAEENELVRYALERLVESESGMVLVGEASTVAETVTGCSEIEPDVLIVDTKLAADIGAAVCGPVTAACEGTAVLVLGEVEDEDAEAKGVVSAGARGYLLATTSPERIAHAIRSVADGDTVLDHDVASRLLVGQSGLSADADGSLSRRELEVLQLMAKGLSNKQIGHALWIGVPTVKTHVSHILKKLGQPDRTAAVLAAVRLGLVRITPKH